MYEKKNYGGSYQENHMDIDSIIKDVFKQWWVILLVTISAMLLAGAYKKLTYSPVYETSMTFAVSKSGFSNNLAYDNLNSAESVTTKFTQVAGSSVLKKRVCEELGLSSFDAEVVITTVESSNLMTLSVTSDSPEMSYKIIHSVMDVTMELGSELMDTVAVKVLMQPVVPAAPKTALDTTSAMKKAGIAAAVFMILIFAMISYFKDTVKNSEDAKTKLDTRLLGTIHHEKKRRSVKSSFKNIFKKEKTGLSIEDPLISFSYAESIRMAATRARAAMDRKNAKVLLVTSVSENEGKSTVAANLALALTQEEKKIALIDCDFRNPSQYKLFDIESSEDGDFAQYLMGNQPIAIKNAGSLGKIGLLCSTKPHQHVLNHDVVERLRVTIRVLLRSVDYIIIDTSPMALVADGEAVASLADASVLVVQQDMMEAKYINDTIDLLNRTNAKVLGCIFNNVHKGIFAKTAEKNYYGGKYGSKYGNKYGNRYIGKYNGRKESNK